MNVIIVLQIQNEKKGVVMGENSQSGFMSQVDIKNSIKRNDFYRCFPLELFVVIMANYIFDKSHICLSIVLIIAFTSTNTKLFFSIQTLQKSPHSTSLCPQPCFLYSLHIFFQLLETLNPWSSAEPCKWFCNLISDASGTQLNNNISSYPTSTEL